MLCLAIEHYTAVLGEWILNSPAHDAIGTDPVMLDMLRWHGAEEVEHKAVAFDTMKHLRAGYWRQVRAQLVVAPVMLLLWIRGVRFLYAVDPRCARHVTNTPTRHCTTSGLARRLSSTVFLSNPNSGGRGECSKFRRIVRRSTSCSTGTRPPRTRAGKDSAGRARSKCLPDASITGAALLCAVTRCCCACRGRKVAGWSVTADASVAQVGHRHTRQRLPNESTAIELEVILLVELTSLLFFSAHHKIASPEGFERTALLSRRRPMPRR